jgi:uncharacterized protein (TIGR03437 family)
MSYPTSFRMYCLLLVVAAACPLRGQSVIAVTCPIQASGGQVLSCPATLTLGAGVTVDSLTFGVIVTPLGEAPSLSSALSFSDSIGGAFSGTDGVNSAISVIWADLSPSLSGTRSLGSIAISIPSSAEATESYMVTITGASASLRNTLVTLSAAPASAITISGTAATPPAITTVSASAGGQPLVAPNTYVSIYGTGFAAVGFTDTWSQSVSTGTLPTALDGVSVTVGGQSAYLAYLSASQINVVLPEVGLGLVQIVVSTPTGSSAPFTVTSQQYLPALFSWPGNQPVATHLNYTYAAAGDTFSAVSTIPSAPGETIVLWGAGFGPTNPQSNPGLIVPLNPTYQTLDTVSATLNGAPIEVYNNTAALAPGYTGLYQIAVTIPESLPNGAYSISVSVNGQTSPTLSLAIQN